VWQRIADNVGVEVDPLHHDPRPGDVRHSYASIARAREQLGYAPRVELEEGLRHTIPYFRDRTGVGTGAGTPERMRVAV
jgi:nucleoside-diphosphate-sugar epimerase